MSVRSISEPSAVLLAHAGIRHWEQVEWATQQRKMTPGQWWLIVACDTRGGSHLPLPNQSLPWPNIGSPWQTIPFKQMAAKHVRSSSFCHIAIALVANHNRCNQTINQCQPATMVLRVNEKMSLSGTWPPNLFNSVQSLIQSVQEISNHSKAKQLCNSQTGRRTKTTVQPESLHRNSNLSILAEPSSCVLQ